MIKKICFIIIIILISINVSNSQWEMLKGPGDNRYINSMDIDGNQILISIFTDVYYSNDMGKKWLHINKDNDFTFNSVENLLIYKNKLFVNSIGGVIDISRGLYSTPDFGKTWEYADLHSRKFFRFESQIFTLSSSKILYYNIEQNQWNKVFDTIPYKYGLNTCFLDSNYWLLGYTVSNEDIAKGFKPKNIGIYNKHTREWTFVCDTVSEIWKKHILCITKKDSTFFVGTSKGVYTSNDKGLNWKLSTIHLKDGDSLYPFDYSVHKLYAKDKYLYAICSPDTSSEFFQNSSSSFICYSTNNGAEWLADTLFTWYSPTEIGFVDNAVIIATKSGLFSSNFALTEKINLINQTLRGVYVLDFDCDKNIIYTATPYGRPGISYSTDYGSSWNTLNNELMNYGISKIAVKNNHFFAGVNFKSFYVSNDSGKTFTRITSENGLSDQSVLTIKIIDSLVYVGTLSGLYVSQDWGKSWTNRTSSYNFRVYCIEKIDNRIILGSDNNVVMLSSDNGLKWVKKTISDEYSNTIMSINFKKDKIIFGTTHSPKDINDQFFGRGLYISKDNGDTFEKYKTGLSDSLGVIALLTFDNYEFLASNKYGGVFYSTNQGENWTSYTIGLTNRVITKIKILGKYLFASTEGGMYRVHLSDFGIVGVDEIEVKPDYLWASVPYPNPAKEFVQAKIYWDTNNDIEQAELAVYDIYGTKIGGKDKISLVPENEYSGIIKWECNGVPNGIFLITIHHGTKKQIIKVCIVR